MGTQFMDSVALIGKVMLVDDDMLRKCVSAILAAIGFDVIEAADGLEALEKFQVHHDTVVVVIMDINMPRLNGIEAIKKIREIDPSAKVIISSGRTEPMPTDLKPDALLPKPYTFSTLRDVIKQVIQVA